MGKKRAQKDRAYQTASEWREEGGGHKGRLQGAGSAFKRLPFNCCAITFQPFEDPVAAPDGTVMDIVNAVPYVTRFKRHPASGEPLELRDLVKLNFYKNADGEYACPVLNKVFSENTHIVAIKTTGNVYCWEAIDQLCLKPKNMRDLITEEPFTRRDIIHIQDPLNLTGKNLADFDHLKHGRSIQEEAEPDPLSGINAAAIPEDTKRTLAALGSHEAAAAFSAGGGGKKAQAERALAEAKAKAQGSSGASIGSDPRLRSAPRDTTSSAAIFRPGAATWNTDEQGLVETGLGAVHFDASAGRPVPPPYSHTWLEGHTSTGATSKSLTSTSMTVATKSERTKVLQQLRPTKKGYLRLHTSLGDLNLELHCDLAPKTCENFMALAEGGYYTGTVFHRCIKNFMIQGGDPTGTGKGGVSVFGPSFPDEPDSRLVHDGRGVLSMANSGPNSNGSQFFILFKSARHLDFKHTVFGKVVGGFETLTAMERAMVDDEDRPLQEIQIIGATIFVNPYKDLIEEEGKKVAAEAKKKEAAARGGLDDAMPSGEFGAWFTDPAGSKNASGSGGVGKYLQSLPAKVVAGPAGGIGPSPPPGKKLKPTSAGFTNFDAW